MAKRILFLWIFLSLCLADSFAVLKEKDLENTLSILRTELTAYHKELSGRSTLNRQRSEIIKQKLIDVLKKSNQNALMLYSQKYDYVFDLTYACHEATEQYQNFQREQLPFREFLESNDREIARYDSLINSLRQMQPTMLSHRARVDRSVCLTLATNIRNTLTESRENTQDYIRIYDLTEQHLKRLNDYANKRYSDIQTSIFKNGGDDYFTILSNAKTMIAQMRNTVAQKYTMHKGSISQWDGKFIIGLFVIIIFYGIIATILNLAVIRYLVPARFHTPEFMKKRACITMASSTVTFAVILGIVRATTEQNFIIMASDLLVEYAWLLGVILISLLLRLNSTQIRSAFRIYSPLIVMGFIVITFRIILIPNELVNVIFPPMLLICALWQWSLIKRHKRNIPRSDMFYTYCSQVIFISSVVLSWMGYTLVSVQLLIWWIMQLTCILTITCLRRWLTLQRRVKQLDSKEITRTWSFDLLYQVLLPVMGVMSVMISIYWAADVFNLSDLCWHIFSTNIVDTVNIRLSVLRMAIVISLWFVFSYLSHTTLKLLQLHFKNQDPTTAESRSMMGKNVIQVIIWGAWFLLSMSVLGVSLTWLMVISGGLSTGIGFASKDILENLYYGVSLMTGRIKVGDLIECDGIRGKVASISYTSTLIESADGSVIAFQNSQLFTKNYKNLTRNHGFGLSAVVFGVAYGSDIKKVSSVVEKAVHDMHHPDIDAEKPVKTILTDFGDSSVNMKLICWVDVLKQAIIESEIKTCIYNALNEHDIEIPFPQCEVKIK
ncbi:MAG: mechanosensitive ion channel family protein [Prevotella sp.]